MRIRAFEISSEYDGDEITKARFRIHKPWLSFQAALDFARRSHIVYFLGNEVGFSSKWMDIVLNNSVVLLHFYKYPSILQSKWNQSPTSPQAARWSVRRKKCFDSNKKTTFALAKSASETLYLLTVQMQTAMTAHDAERVNTTQRCEIISTSEKKEAYRDCISDIGIVHLLLYYNVVNISNLWSFGCM